MITIKRNLSRKLSLAGLSCLLMLTGCALSPQSIHVNPRVTVQESLKNSLDSRVSVTVFDERISPAIGYRGGVYESSVITMADNLALALRSSVERGLREAGVEVVTGDAPQLQVYLDELEYHVPEGSYVTQVAVRAKIRAVVLSQGRRFEGTYSADVTERVARAPSERKNQELVDQVLSDVLTRLFNDGEFQGFMAQL